MVKQIRFRSIAWVCIPVVILIVQSLNANPMARVSRVSIRDAEAAGYLGLNPFDLSVRPVAAIRPEGYSTPEIGLVPTPASGSLPSDTPVYTRPAVRVPFRPALRSTFRPVF